MRFEMLGPLRVVEGGRRIPIPASQQRVVLAVLLAEAGRAVSTQRLVHEIWGDCPPRASRRTLQGYIFRLRRMIGSDALVTRPGGYELIVSPAGLDVEAFGQLAAEGRRMTKLGQLDAAATRFEQSLALWRGPALADVPPSPAVVAEAARLDLLRLRVVEEHLDVRLALGDHDQVAVHARDAVAHSPLRERFWEQLVLALGRAGRRGEALDAFQQARRVLVAELGVEPGPKLQELQRDILTAGSGETAPARGTPVWTVPAELPADVHAFTGRNDELSRLDALVADQSAATAVAVVTITGAAGIGKTALAVRWAHSNRDRFPDGQLFMDLRGFSLQAPLRPIDALARFLRAVGVPSEAVPVDQDEAMALYRSRLADRRVLVVLDNARDAGQVRPLLPAGPGCLVVVTSRDQLIGLTATECATPIMLDVLSPFDAERLLVLVAGVDRVPTAAAEVADLSLLCGRLPLALRIAGAHLAMRPAASIGAYVTKLREDRLEALSVPDDPGVGVRVAFDQSYAALAEPAARLFRRLGIAPGSDLSEAAIAALAGASPTEVEPLVHRLCQAQLISEVHPGRFGMHDLTRLYAAEKAAAIDGEEDCEATLGRLFDAYLRRLDAAARMLYPHLVRLPMPDGMGDPEDFPDAGQASQWLDAERANLVAAIRTAAVGSPESAWRLADAIRGYLYLRMHLVDWTAVASVALEAAEGVGDPGGRASAHLSLSSMHWARGHNQTAIEHLLPALDLAREARWLAGEATVLGNLGAAYGNMGQMARAAEFTAQALDIDRRLGLKSGQAIRLTNIALNEMVMGQPAAAVEHLTEALALQRQDGSPAGVGRISTNLGEAYYETSRFDQALVTLTEALRLQREVGDRHTEAHTLRVLAACHADMGDGAVAMDLARLAVQIATEVGEERFRAGALIVLGTLLFQGGGGEQAVEHCRQALEAAYDINDRLLVAEAMVALSAAHLYAGNLAPAAVHAATALKTALAQGYRLVESDSYLVLAEVAYAERRYADALDHCSQAVQANKQIQRPYEAVKAERLADRIRANRPGTATRRPRRPAEPDQLPGPNLNL